MDDIRNLLDSGENELTELHGDGIYGAGDFRSKECLELLDEADIVVTNPPFSLFREYVATLMEHDKRFVIMGNINAITYKEIFPLIRMADSGQVSPSTRPWSSPCPRNTNRKPANAISTGGR